MALVQIYCKVFFQRSLLSGGQRQSNISLVQLVGRIELCIFLLCHLLYILLVSKWCADAGTKHVPLLRCHSRNILDSPTIFINYTLVKTKFFFSFIIFDRCQFSTTSWQDHCCTSTARSFSSPEIASSRTAQMNAFSRFSTKVRPDNWS